MSNPIDPADRPTTTTTTPDALTARLDDLAAQLLDRGHTAAPGRPTNCFTITAEPRWSDMRHASLVLRTPPVAGGGALAAAAALVRSGKGVVWSAASTAFTTIASASIHARFQRTADEIQTAAKASLEAVPHWQHAVATFVTETRTVPVFYFQGCQFFVGPVISDLVLATIYLAHEQAIWLFERWPSESLPELFRFPPLVEEPSGAKLISMVPN